MTLNSITQKRSSVNLEYYNSFVFKIPYSSFIRGMNLYSSYDNINFNLRRRYLASSSGVITSSGYIYFTFDSTTHNDDGRRVYFYSDTINSMGSTLVTSSTALVNSIPTNSESIVTSYNGFSVTLSWAAIDQTDGKNSNLAYYNIYRGIASLLASTKYNLTSVRNSGLITIQLDKKYTAVFTITWNTRAKWQIYLDNEDIITLTNDNLAAGYAKIRNFDEIFKEELQFNYSAGGETLLVQVPVPLSLGGMQIGTTFVIYPDNFTPPTYWLYDDSTFAENQYYYYIVSSATLYRESTAVVSRSMVYTYVGYIPVG